MKKEKGKEKEKKRKEKKKRKRKRKINNKEEEREREEREESFLRRPKLKQTGCECSKVPLRFECPKLSPKEEKDSNFFTILFSFSISGLPLEKRRVPSSPQPDSNLNNLQSIPQRIEPQKHITAMPLHRNELEIPSKKLGIHPAHRKTIAQPGHLPAHSCVCVRPYLVVKD